MECQSSEACAVGAHVAAALGQCDSKDDYKDVEPEAFFECTWGITKRKWQAQAC